MKKRPKPARPDKLLVISDIHVGSTLGLLPPGYTTIEGNKIEQNAVQLFLWWCWLDLMANVERAMAGSNYALLLNGDMIEGDHHGTKQIWSKDVGDHINCAADILQPVVARAAKTFIVQGTESHTNNAEITLGRILRAENNPDTGQPAFNRLHLTIHGCRLASSHHIGTATRAWTKATQLASILAEERVQAVKNGEEPPQVVCRAHRHTFDSYTDGRGLVCVSPPFQLLTRFAHKIVPEARTQPGAYILDWSGKQEGSLPEVRAFTYNCPPPTSIRI